MIVFCGGRRRCARGANDDRAVGFAEPPGAIRFARCRNQEACLSRSSHGETRCTSARLHGFDPGSFEVPAQLGERGAGTRAARPIFHDAEPESSWQRDEDQNFVLPFRSDGKTQEAGLWLINARNLRIPRVHSRPSDKAWSKRASRNDWGDSIVTYARNAPAAWSLSKTSRSCACENERRNPSASKVA